MQLTLRRGIALGAIASLIVAGSAGARLSQPGANTPAALAASGNVDWPVFGGNQDNNRYSPLKQIATSNVYRLGLAWTMQEGKNFSAFESTPVVVHGVMYVTTNTDQVRALDAATGKLLWQYTPTVDFYKSIAGGGGGAPVHRGVAVYNGIVYLTTFDARLIALQASTGEKLWEAPLANPKDPYANSSPVTYWNGLVIAGSEVGDSGMRGYIAAYNAKTGKMVWRFYTVPKPGQGWNQPKGANHGGGDVWMPVVVDNATGMVFAGTGNPSPDFQNVDRPGCDPWVNAIVALDARTGKFRWAHSEFCNDVWDYDSHQGPMLFNMMVNGKMTRVVEHGNKSGTVFIYDALTGKVIAKSPHLSDWSTPHLAPTAKGAKVCPGSAGGIEYSPPSYSPQAGLVYQQVLNECAIFTTIPRGDANIHKLGQVDTGGSSSGAGPISGAIVAINPHTGQIAWRLSTTRPCIGGSMTTAGGLVFAGCDDGHFRALDVKTGQVDWDANLGLAFGAAPITYEVNGMQYIAVAVGGSLIAAGDNIPTGGTLAVFKLGGAKVHKLPAVQNGVTVPVRLPDVKGLTQVNPYMYVNVKTQYVLIKIVAGATSDNNGFNFDGYSKGKATFVVPAHWSVDVLFSNKAALPHSVAITDQNVQPAKLTHFGFGVMIAPNNVQAGIVNGQPTQYTSIVADRVGKWYLACLVPGHLQSGMWDNFEISGTAKLPSISVSP